MRSAAASLAVMVATACGGGGTVPVEKPVEQVAIAPGGDAGASDAAGGAGSDVACEDPCLMLRDTALDKLPDVYAARCGKPLLPNNKDCGLLDYERNCIYAAHG